MIPQLLVFLIHNFTPNTGFLFDALLRLVSSDKESEAPISQS